MTRLNNSFFQHPTLQVARGLLGKVLTTTIKGKTTSGIIVECEAYHGDTDQASHAWRGPTPRNRIMFEGAGLCYVYFIYGMHYCVNVVTESKCTGAAVLIRALEPLEGIETMRLRRHKVHTNIGLTNGPAKLCEALAIDGRLLGEHLLKSRKIRLSAGRAIKPGQITSSPRIVISKSKHLKWRFYIKDNPWVSKV